MSITEIKDHYFTEQNFSCAKRQTLRLNLDNRCSLNYSNNIMFTKMIPDLRQPKISGG